MTGYRVCRICRAIMPDESDMLIEVWRKKKMDDRLAQDFVGYFCDMCLPGSAQIDDKLLVYIVPRYSNK